LPAPLLELATAVEGHPDNVAAALLGGVVVCADGEAHRIDPPAELEALLVVPHRAVGTQRARSALPASVPLADAVYNTAHGALLMLGLAGGDDELVARGLGDMLHQPYRAHLYPRSAELLGSARSGRRSRAPARRCSSGSAAPPPRPSPRHCASGCSTGPRSSRRRSSLAAPRWSRPPSWTPSPAPGRPPTRRRVGWRACGRRARSPQRAARRARSAARGRRVARAAR